LANLSRFCAVPSVFSGHFSFEGRVPPEQLVKFMDLHELSLEGIGLEDQFWAQTAIWACLRVCHDWRQTRVRRDRLEEIGSPPAFLMLGSV
jgi:hypothetical protein